MWRDSRNWQGILLDDGVEGLYASFAYIIDDRATTIAPLTLTSFAGDNMSIFSSEISGLSKMLRKDTV